VSFKYLVYPTPLAVATAVADDLTQAWQQGPFHLALAGGSTPRLLYQLLATRPLPSELHIWFSDERCVPPEHPDSNFAMAWEAWLQHVDLPPSQIHRMRGEDPPEQAAAAYRQALQNDLPNGAFDRVLLGMGNDGHTASLFPGQTAALQAQVDCIATHAPTGQARLSLSLTCLNRARSISVLVTGPDKAVRVTEALTDSQQALPIQGLTHATWWLDRAAAHHLPQGDPNVANH
jgi:6-phosphogluconolactonase